MAITKTITCDGCGEDISTRPMGAFELSPYSITLSAFELGEPISKPNEDMEHYCSPGCVTREVSRRVQDMWERRRQTVDSISRRQGFVESAMKGGEV